MQLERLLQINMAALAALGALLLGMGHRSAGPPLLVMLAAGLSVWLTDFTGKFRLGPWTANVLMLVGAVFSLRDIYPPRNEMQAVGLSWFLVYLQIILLFQKKDQWKYWLLVMLSLLEVVVATLFSQDIWFGALLAVYMLLGFSAMTLLMMFHQWGKYCQEKESSESKAGGWETALAVGGLLGRRWGAAIKTLAHGASHSGAAQRKGSVANWPLSSQPAEFTGVPSSGSHVGVGRELFRHLGAMGLCTMALTFVLFFAVPRFGQIAWRGPVAAEPESLVGFTDKVTLGELGKIIESRDKVMQVSFCPRYSDTPQPLNGDVYLQGVYLMYYKDGRWMRGQPSGNLGTSPLLTERQLPELGFVRLKIVIESLDRNELFYVVPYLAVDNRFSEVSINYPAMVLYRPDHRCSTQFRYTLGTTAIIGGEQSPLTPAMENEYPEQLAGLPPNNIKKLPGLVKLAKQWIDESGLPESDRIGRARYIERKLASSGRFQYGLSGVARDPKIDPIEDFITKHPQGHCEYFATALALMLRSQGIPARMASGFKCERSDWSELGGFYQVRQLHAHTWVEAYLPPDQLPAELKHGGDYWSTFDHNRSWKEGGWLRLDATPGGAGNESKSWFTPVRDGFDWLDTVWSKYVVDLDCQRQRDAIYQPIADAATRLWRELTNVRRWQSMFDSVAVALYLDHLGREAKWLLMGVVGVVLMAILVGIGWLLFRVGRRLRARWTGNHRNRSSRRRVEIAFYRRFEGLMAREGLVRGSAQTQQEFAAAAGAHFASLTGESRAAGLPSLVADAFYRVRFGGTPLDNLQTQAVEQALVEIAAIRKNRASGKQ